MTQAFQLLHPAVQRKLWDMRWTDLRPIQVDAIEHLLGGTPTDCIIASPTASGKTEAAFLPVLSAIADDPVGSVRAMYIGPLKALINDQFGRLDQLCERMEMPVCRWHGDVDDGPRKALLARPAGILLITPESLEAMFVLRSTQLAALFGRLAYVVIDEVHAFLGSPRGAQLISQLHRLRIRAGVDPIRIGLSATLGDPAIACRWLGRGRPVQVIESSGAGAAIRLRVRGLWRVRDEERDEDEDPTVSEIARAILLACHGKTNLVFANSKSLIEAVADELQTQATAMSLADEIVVHHGSLSKEEREHAEQALRSGRPCTAVCSNTLELGIDIGAIDEVVQVSPPWSVASLIQRLGRSGRREHADRILRGYFVEDVPAADATIWDRLHLDLVRGLATIELMLEPWIEPPDAERANLSTLVQQILSLAAETGGIRAHELFSRVAGSGAFFGLTQTDFVTLLRELGKRDLIEQLPDATLVLGLKGQRIVEHYSFYAAFKAPTEFQVRFRDRTIGTLPESLLPGEGEHVILAARRWLVEEIDLDRKEVHVVPSKGRRPPRFASGQPEAHPRLHARMRALLVSAVVPQYLDDTAAEILRRARQAAAEGEIDAPVRVLPDRTRISLWAGSRVHRTLWLLFASAGVRIESASDVGFELLVPPEIWVPVLRRFTEAPNGEVLARFAEERLFARVTEGEKFDAFLPAALWRASYVRERLAVDETVQIGARILATVANASSQTVTAPAPGGRAVALSNLEAWADEIVRLDARKSMPVRVVLVPSEPHAHALRRELAARAPASLLGTHFFTAAAAAVAVLDAADVLYTPGEEIRRPLRVRKVLRGELSLRTYRNADLKTPGWEEAFASAIEQLEAANLTPDDLDRLHDPRASDLAVVWRALDRDAPSSWTTPRSMTEAANLLERQPELWPFAGPVLASVSVGVDAAHARLLRAIPQVTYGVLAGRPARRRAVERMTALLGGAIGDASVAVEVRERPDELGILGAMLFAGPDHLNAAERPRSNGPDGGVSLELHSGVDEELDATARWVTDEVYLHRTPLQELAILVPTAEPLGTLVAERIRALSWPDGVSPVYVAAGRPAMTTAGGARLLQVLTGVRAYLPRSVMVELLPRLRLGEGHVTPARARKIVDTLGTLGGSQTRPEAVLDWCARLATLDVTEAPISAIEALVAVVAEMVRGASLDVMWRTIRSFVETHLIAPRDMKDVIEQLGLQIVELARDPVTAGVTGPDALELITTRLEALRLHDHRFGDPAIYVGTIASAAGLAFTSVRVVGLAEGLFPGTLREDAVLPSELRVRLPLHAIGGNDDYATSRLHAFDQIVHGTAKRLVVSAPRADIDGSEREPASTFVEIAAALARPNARTGARGRVVPTMADVERDAFAVSRERAACVRDESPLTAWCWLRRSAAGGADLPSIWSTHPIVDPAAMAARALGMRGLLGPEALAMLPIGTTHERPLSAASLRMLLACPQRFLLERLLGFYPRGRARDGHRLDPAAYGALFHTVAEKFAVLHGVCFGRRDEDLATWLARGDDLACTELSTFLVENPLVGAGVVETERRRLRRDVRTFITDDWNGGLPREFLAAEREFAAWPAGVAIDVPGGPLFVAGRIDRIDLEDGITLVRDLKTGRARPREDAAILPDIDVDLQLALYVAVARQFAAEWNIPDDVAAAYVYVDHLSSRRERSFRTDRLVLRDAGNRWLGLAASLVREQSYVKTADEDECARCPFSAVCGDATAASEDVLRDATGTLAVFRELKA